MASHSSPFPSLKRTGDDKHDMEVYIEDLIDYCVMQNWYDPAKETEAAKWIKPDKAMACLRASLSPAARSIYKYSLGLTEENQKKPDLVVAALVSEFQANDRNFLALFKRKANLLPRGKLESATKALNASTKILLMSS